MKTKFFILLMSITLLACRTIKSNTESSSKTKQQTDSSKMDVQIAEKNLEQIEKQSGEWTAKLTTYDTTLPTDKVTGKLPIKSELLITNKSQTEIKTAEKEKTNTLSIRKSGAKYESKVQEKTHSIQQSNYWWVWVLVGILISIILFLSWKFIPSD